MLVMLLVTSLGWGADRWFDEDGIDYWGGKPYGEIIEVYGEVENRAKEEEQIEAKRNKEKSFSWDEYTDPGKAEFWTDVGDFAPPEPLLEVIRNPTDDNIQRYREWMKAKAEIASEVSQLVWSEPPVFVDWSGVDVVYFYSSGCPHCQRNTSAVLELQELGARVLPVHLDRPSPAYPHSAPYTDSMALLVQVQGTPTFVIRKGAAKRVVRGYAPISRLENELMKLEEEQ